MGLKATVEQKVGTVLRTGLQLGLVGSLALAGCAEGSSTEAKDESQAAQELEGYFDILRGEEPDASLVCDQDHEENYYSGSIEVDMSKQERVVIDVAGTTNFSYEKFIIESSPEGLSSVIFRSTSLEPGSGLEVLEPLEIGDRDRNTVEHTVPDAFGNNISFTFELNKSRLTATAICPYPEQ